MSAEPTALVLDEARFQASIEAVETAWAMDLSGDPLWYDFAREVLQAYLGRQEAPEA